MNVQIAGSVVSSQGISKVLEFDNGERQARNLSEGKKKKWGRRLNLKEEQPAGSSNNWYHYICLYQKNKRKHETVDNDLASLWDVNVQPLFFGGNYKRAGSSQSASPAAV